MIKQNKTKIFCYAVAKGYLGYAVYSLSEDGTGLCSHISTNLSFAKHDIGFNSNWQHDIYKEYYPDGYELLWLEEKELENHCEFKKALKTNKENHVLNKKNEDI